MELPVLLGLVAAFLVSAALAALAGRRTSRVGPLKGAAVGLVLGPLGLAIILGMVRHAKRFCPVCGRKTPLLSANCPHCACRLWGGG